MSDVAMHHTADGGEISFVAGQPEMSDGLFNAVYLSLFGGNEDDDGTDATKSLEWWGNKVETDPAARYRSETQAALRGMPAIPANLQRLEDCVIRDLTWMTDSKLATVVTADASMPRANWVKLDVKVEINGQTFPFILEQPWTKR